MLFLAGAALVMPAIFELVEGRGLPSPGAEIVDYGSTVEHLSVAVAVVLIVTYVRRPDLLAAHPPRPLQPAVRGGGDLRLERSPLGDRCSRSPASRSA